MAYTLKGYSHFPYYLLRGLVSDLSNQGSTIIKCCLLKNTYSFDQDNHNAYDDVSSYEITDDATLDPDGDYTAGGVQLAGLAGGASVSISGRVTTVDFDDGTWTDVTIGAYKLAIYDATPVADSDKVLIAYCDFGGLKASNSGTYKVVLNASGLFTITVPA